MPFVNLSGLQIFRTMTTKVTLEHVERALDRAKKLDAGVKAHLRKDPSGKSLMKVTLM